MSGTRFTEGPNGFAWGALEVRRLHCLDGRVALSLSTDSGRTIDVYVSATGRSLRFFENHVELTLTPKATA